MPTKKAQKKAPGKPFTKGNKFAFKPGQSGNPAGRPRDAITPHLRELAQEQAPGKDKRTYGRMVAEMLYAEALGGNVQAAKEILDRLDGKPRQAVDLTVDERKSDIIERAINNLMAEEQISREDAIAQLSAIAPDIQWE